MKKLTLFAALLTAQIVHGALPESQYENFRFYFPEKLVFESLCKPTDYDAKTLSITRNGCECARNIQAAKDGLAEYENLDNWNKETLESETIKHAGMSGEEIKALYLSALVAASHTNDELSFVCGTYKCTDKNATIQQKFERNKKIATKKAAQLAEAALEHRRNTVVPQKTEEINGRTFVIDQNGIEYEKVGENFYPAVYRQPK